jgi:hypothetical protein
MITPERLRELLTYDPDTGVFTWRGGVRRVRPGMIAGHAPPSTGYRRIFIDQKPYVAHRLAWLYVHGRWPLADIDHADGDPGNNALANLREASRTQNHGNRKRACNNRSGFKGVSFKPECNKWYARIYVSYRQHHLGYFSTPEAAAAAYAVAARRHYGEFARTE